MQSNLTNSSLNEGILSKFPILASIGLASVLGASTQQSNAATVDQSSKKSNSLPKDESLYSYISKWEGKSYTVYKDSAGKLTIGIGHYLNNSDSDRKLLQSLFGDSVSYDNLLSGKQSLTDYQVEKLFSVDVKIKERIASKIIPKYATFPQKIKNAIINGLYRGDLGPKTIKLINDEKWESVPTEYLNHQNAISGPEQIKKRMKTNAAMFASYSQKTNEAS